MARVPTPLTCEARQESIEPDVTWAVRSRASLAERRRGCSPPKDGAVSGPAPLLHKTPKPSKTCAERRQAGRPTPRTEAHPSNQRGARPLDSGLADGAAWDPLLGNNRLAAQPGALSERGAPDAMGARRWGSPRTLVNRRDLPAVRARLGAALWPPLTQISLPSGRTSRRSTLCTPSRPVPRCGRVARE